MGKKRPVLHGKGTPFPTKGTKSPRIRSPRPVLGKLDYPKKKRR